MSPLTCFGHVCVHLLHNNQCDIKKITSITKAPSVKEFLDSSPDVNRHRLTLTLLEGAALYVYSICSITKSNRRRLHAHNHKLPRSHKPKRSAGSPVVSAAVTMVHQAEPLPLFDDIFESTGSDIVINSPKPKLGLPMTAAKDRIMSLPVFDIGPKLTFHRNITVADFARGNNVEKGTEISSAFSSVYGSPTLNLDTLDDDAEPQQQKQLDALLQEYRGNSLITPYLQTLQEGRFVNPGPVKTLNLFFYDLLDADKTAHNSSENALRYYVSRTFWQILFLAAKSRLKLYLFPNQDIKVMNVSSEKDHTLDLVP